MSWSAVAQVLAKFGETLTGVMKVVTKARVRLTLLLIAGLMLLAMTWIVFIDNRETIKLAMSGVQNSVNALMYLSKSDRSRIEHLVNTDPNVDMASVVMIDFATSKRTLVYNVISDANIRRIIDEQDRIVGGPITSGPLISSNAGFNEQTNAIIQGDFRCYDSKTTMTVDAYPGLGTAIKTTCLVPVPPRLRGRLGYIALHSIKLLTPYEQDKIRSTWMLIADELVK